MVWSLSYRFRLLFVALLVTVWILSTAAAGNAQQTALVLAGAIGAGSAFIVPLLKSTFGLQIDGKRMVVIAYIVAAVVALVALWLTGNLNFQDPARMAETIGVAASLQQFVFQVFKDSSGVGPFLKDGTAAKAPAATTPK